MFLSLDNPVNPFVRLRNSLPHPLLKAMKISPYYIGVTAGRRRAGKLLEEAGFAVEASASSVHSPRLPAIWLARLLRAIRPTNDRPWLVRALRGFEGLRRWPTRDLTGYYVAFRAVKR